MHNILVREKDAEMKEDEHHLELGSLLKRKVKLLGCIVHCHLQWVKYVHGRCFSKLTLLIAALQQHMRSLHSIRWSTPTASAERDATGRCQG